jgi:hypothetical protein
MLNYARSSRLTRCASRPEACDWSLDILVTGTGGARPLFVGNFVGNFVELKTAHPGDDSTAENEQASLRTRGSGLPILRQNRF